MGPESGAVRCTCPGTAGAGEGQAALRASAETRGSSKRVPGTDKNMRQCGYRRQPDPEQRNGHD